MKQNQKITLAIGLGVVILLNIVIFGWLLADFFSGPNGPEETVVTTDGSEEATDDEMTAPEEFNSAEKTTEEPTTEELSTEGTTEEPTKEWIEAEIPYEGAKKVIHTFSWGDGKGQLGYWKTTSISGADSYPQAFVIEDDAIYVLDNANHRIVVYENGQYSEIKLSNIKAMSQVFDMRYQNGWIGLWDRLDEIKETKLYRKDDSVRMEIKTPEAIKAFGTVEDILEIGETYVVWDVKVKATGQNNAYRYDWVEESIESVEMPKEPSVSVSDKTPIMIGTYNDETYYYLFHYGEWKYTVNRETADSRLYTVIAITPQRGHLEMYLSTDGRFYILEMFEERVEISELKLELGTVE